MVSLWGRKKKDEYEDEEEEEDTTRRRGGSSSRPSSKRTRDRGDPNERTRLLDDETRHHRADGYLDPDDPAVSPYNLWTVRFLRWLSVLFTMITFVWWVLLLVSIFVSPPGMNTRGSGFTDFSYSCLTLGTLFTSLIFFADPSRATQVSMGVLTLLLLVDVIIILAVNRIRAEEGWVGILSSVWSLVMAGWSVMLDRVVAWGKREEEERLTGRAERRRSLRQWLGVLFATVLDVVYIIIVVLLTATIILRATDAGLEPDGQRYLVDSNKYKIHLNCIGNSTRNPVDGKRAATILLESGEVPSEQGLEHWAYAAWENGTIGRYCYWDRPGYAWSDDAPSPHSAGMAADALSEALVIAGEKGPWIAVSAGYGSLVSRIFTARHPHEIAGIMMIDPLHEDLLYRVGAGGRGFKLWGYGIVSPLGLQRLGGAFFKGRTKEDRVYGNSVWNTGKFLKAKLQENLVAESLTKSDVSTARTVTGSKIPLVVVSSGIETGKDSEWKRKQKSLTKITKRLVGWDVVSKAPHEVWQTQNGRDVMEKRLGDLVEASGK